ncbi:MAG: glycosyltransferase family 2 protein [Chitinispirillia bacterium]|nr:glycosyltransferase family 2 protein [Chitinispirillia bacterium]
MKISVIIPIYNAENYLKQTLDSIRFQTYKNLEIVCVLDCPADRSAKIIEDTAKVDHRIKPIYNKQNMGLPSARNIGVENASGEYVHFMDSDDLLSPDFYETMINAVVKEDADAAVCSVFYEKKPKQSIWFGEDETVYGQDKIKRTKVTFAGWAWRYLINKKFWNDHRFSFPDLVPMEDIPVIIRMIFYANKIALCSDAVYFYKNRESSILNDCNREKKQKENRKSAESLFLNFMREHSIKRPGKVYRHYRSFRTKRPVCKNMPVEYGKINKKISVIIPVYNAEKHLKKTMDSIRFQTYGNLEIICVLDCPTDNSAKIIEEIAKVDHRIKLICNQQNMGLPSTRNIGVENASGEYIHFMDSDDLLIPDFYETMINAAVKEDADVAACSVFYEKKPWRSIWFRKSEILSGRNKIKKTEAAFMGWAWRYLISNKFWNERKLSFPDLVPMEDKPAVIPMIYYANKVALCPGAVYFYKYRKSSILNLNSNDKERKKLHGGNRQKARKIFREFMSVNKIKRPSRLLYAIKKALSA